MLRDRVLKSPEEFVKNKTYGRLRERMDLLFVLYRGISRPECTWPTPVSYSLRGNNLPWPPLLLRSYSFVLATDDRTSNSRTRSIRSQDGESQKEEKKNWTNAIMEILIKYEHDLNIAVHHLKTQSIAASYSFLLTLLLTLTLLHYL